MHLCCRSSRIALLFTGVLSWVVVGATACVQRTRPVVTTRVAPPAAPVAIDADAAALLPFGALMVANLGAHEIVNSTAGGDLAALSERLVPFAAQVDFQVKRDLDRVYIGAYSFSGADFLGVLTGNFQVEKITAAASRGLQTPYGIVTASEYAGRRLYTVSNIGFTILTSKTALAGTETAMRRALDRVQAGTVRREFAPWMDQWVTQPGFPVLVASDVAKQSFAKTVTGMLPWLQGMEYVRICGRFNPDTSFGMSGALTYPDPAKASAAAQGLAAIPKTFTMMAALKLMGLDPLVRSMTVNAAGNDVQFSSVIDEKSTRQILRMLTDTLGGRIPAMPQTSPQGHPPAATHPGATGGTSI